MADGEHQETPIRLFYSYSHEDAELRKRLEDHLAALRRSGHISEWHDRNIDLGEEWAKEIDRNLASADIILLLVSASFLASEYCWSVEMTKALERHSKGEAKVIPVILRPCAWHITPFAKLQAAPSDTKPVTSWSDPHEALYDVATRIERVVNNLRIRRAQLASLTSTAVSPHTIGDFDVFRDVAALWCPEMVTLPSGTFLMGSPESDRDGYSDERPQHRVTIGYRFALGRYPVTVAEFSRFADASGHCQEGGLHVWMDSGGWKEELAKSWRYPGFSQTDFHPVVGISWWDAVAYCEWLAEETGEPYRLPSEAEWEYACRAGTTKRYAFGDRITPTDANYTESELGETTEAGTYPPNSWGLYDMHGNVWEWVEDNWHGYDGAPNDGSAWTDGERSEINRSYIYRGGSWGSPPRFLGSAFRSGKPPHIRLDVHGFRVARTLD